MKLVDVNGLNFDEFLEHWRVAGAPLNGVTLINDNQPALAECSTAQVGRGLFAQIRHGWLDGILQLNVPDDAVEAAVPEPPPAPEPLLGLINNDDCNWLTYETLFNQRPYRKTNQACQFGTYRIPLDRVKVFVRDNIDKAQLQQLAEAFFPDLKPEYVAAFSNNTWPWKPKPAKILGFVSPEEMVANRNVNRLFRAQYVIMPFNPVDNGPNTNAIGKTATAEYGAPLKKLRRTWDFYKTASRSSIARLTPLKTRKSPWQPLVTSDYSWTYGSQVAAAVADFGRSERGVNLVTEAAGDAAFTLAEAERCYSIKVGVLWVGNSNQQSVYKDKLEENSIVACLRSDLVVAADRKAGRTPGADAELIIQTELLSVTELDTIRPGGQERVGDGMQVRDLSGLDASKIYIPPISIPFLDLQLKTLRRRFDCIEDAAWRDFWKEAYAARIGRAKALFLLRYGLQMGSPNAQNFLLEFDGMAAAGAAGVPTGRVVFRDLGDAYLHREVLWAQLGGAGAPPAAAADKLRMAELNSKVVKYECEVLATLWDYYPQETGTIWAASYGPPGTRPLWHRFSTLSKGSSVAAPSPLGTDPDAVSEGWRRVQATMCEWGLAHNSAYVQLLQDELELDFEIDWAAAPQPDRYLALAADGTEAAGVYYFADRAWEDAAGERIHAKLISVEGQGKLRDWIAG